MPLSPGSRLGAYEVVAPLGEGGMGEVYRARDARLQRDVAIKVLPEAFATDEARQTVMAYAVFSGAHTGEGGPVPPTGKGIQSDYVYVMEFAGGKIRHMTKIWNDGFALTALGWT